MSYGPLPPSPAVSRFSFSMDEEEIELTATASRPVLHQAWSRSSTVSYAQSSTLSDERLPEDASDTASQHGHGPPQSASKTPVVTAKDDSSSLVSVEKRVTGRRFNFVICLFLLGTVPMLAAAAVVLSLVFGYRVNMQGQPDFVRVFNNEVEQDDYDEKYTAYYVNLPVGHLTFASSWASTLAPVCATALMGLASFYISKDYINVQKDGHKLPTPYQLALTIQFIDGNPIAAMIRWLRYRRWRHKQDNSRPLRIAILFALLVLSLAMFVFAADTWLHINIATLEVAISTGWLTYSADYSADFEDSYDMYGFGLSPAFYASNCEGAVNATVCCLNRTDNGTYLLNAQQSLQILYGTSSLAVVMNDQGTSSAWLVNPTIPEVYADGTYLELYEFQATAYQAQTYASQTTCRLATTECDFTTDSSGQSSFFCSDSFGSTLSENELVLEYFTDSSMTYNSTGVGMMPISQPYYFGVAYLSSSVPDWDVSGTDLGTTADGQVGVVLLCNSTTYDMLYTWANNAIATSNMTASNDTVANLFHAPMQETTVATQTLMYDLDLALALVGADAGVNFSTLDPSEINSDVASTFSGYYSAAALAIGAQAISGRYPINGTILELTDVALLSAGPLWLLFAACSLYTLVGAALLAAALLALRDPDVHGFQRRLGLYGIMADRFEEPRAGRGNDDASLFHESEGKRAAGKKVAMERGQDGEFGYRIINGEDEDEEDREEEVGRAGKEEEGRAGRNRRALAPGRAWNAFARSWRG